MSTHNDYRREVERKEKNKIRGRSRGRSGAWFGLGTFGLVGWAVTIPTLLGIALGVWIDHRWPSRYSWTLMFLLIGLGGGCMNAWLWISRERRAIDRERQGNGNNDG
jgi:ATP synthase protein I